MLSERFLSKNVIFFLVILFLFSISPNLFSQIRDWNQLYPTIERPVTDIKFSSFSGISEYGLLLALPGNNGGLAYFTNQDSLNVFSVATNIGAVSITPDESNNRIFCAFGCGSNGDGLFEFDIETQEFERINWCFYPRFVKKLSSGFYFGYGYNQDGGLFHSSTGDEWTQVEFFNGISVTDIEEDRNGNLFISANNQIYFEVDGNYNSFTAPLRINDIYISAGCYSDIAYIACGEDSYSDAVYRVEFDGNEIIGLTYINGFGFPSKIFEYQDYLVVGCKGYFSNLFLLEPVENGQTIEIGDELGINQVNCFEFYPTYENNFIVGTDNGVFLGTNLTAAEENKIEEVTDYGLSNYPNPFNPTTTVEFSIQIDSIIELSIFNVKGQKIRNLANRPFESGTHSIIWNGNNDLGKSVSSGIYFYKINVNGKTYEMKKCLLLK